VAACAISRGEPAEQPLERLLAERLPFHPLVEAARQELEQSRADEAGIAAYFDTRVYAAAGAATWTRPLPGRRLSAGIDANRVSFQSGVEQALPPGWILSAGAAETRLLETEARGDALYQTLAGVQIDIPLLRNRGHEQWRQGRRRASALVEAARSRLLAVVQGLRLESELAWIELLAAAADRDAVRLALERVEALLEETQALVALNAVPEYQIYPARIDTALREEELSVAELRMDTVRAALGALLGEPLPEFPDRPRRAPRRSRPWAQSGHCGPNARPRGRRSGACGTPPAPTCGWRWEAPGRRRIRTLRWGLKPARTMIPWGSRRRSC